MLVAVLDKIETLEVQEQEQELEQEEERRIGRFRSYRIPLPGLTLHCALCGEVLTIGDTCWIEDAESSSIFCSKCVQVMAQEDLPEEEEEDEAETYWYLYDA